MDINRGPLNRLIPLAGQTPAAGPSVEQRLAALESVFKIDPGGSVRIRCRDLTIETDGSVRLQSSSGVEVRAGMSIRIQANMNLTLKADNQAELSAQSTLTLKGSTINE